MNVNESKGPTPLEYYVLRDNVRPLLGFESCLELELISLNDNVEQIGLSVNEVQENSSLLDKFQDVFVCLGCVEVEYSIKLKANSHPTIQPQRNVPLRLRDKLKETLDNLERNNIIAKEPVDWVSNLVIVEKANSTLRLCLDPPDLNEVIEKEDFKPPSFETISNTLSGCKVFSVVDMSNCYWHQKLTEESSFLCVFNSPLVDIDLKECHLAFHVQVKWPRKWSRSILVIFQVHYLFSMILSLEEKINKNMI